MNPLYNAMNGNNIIQQFNEFKKNFKGNPQEQVQQMLNSGKITQEQYNKAVAQANQLKKMLGL